MSVWAPMQYGWGVVYWLTVEGVPVVWTEKATTQTLPAGYTQDASLVIDRSSEVGQLIDRESGIGAGYPLTFHLKDGPVPLAWFKRWGIDAILRQNVLWNDATIHVDDVTGWPGAGTFWLGLERITYTGTAGGGDPRFTGCTRGTAGSLASSHYPGSAGSLATDLPRWWRGRQVRLYASPVSPAGAMTGTALLDEADEVWRGFLDTGPDRVGGMWEFNALALDRRLGTELTAPLTGKVLDTVARFPVEPSHSVAIHLAGWNAAGPPVKQWEFYISFEPFAAYSSGALLSAAEQGDAIIAAWATALPLAVNIVSGLLDAGTFLGNLAVKAFTSTFGWYLQLQAAAVPAGGVIAQKVAFNGSNAPASDTISSVFQTAIAAGQEWPLYKWITNGHHCVGVLVGGLVPPPVTGIAVELDQPVDTLPTFGRIKVGDSEAIFTAAEQAGMLAFFSGLYTGQQKPVSLAAVKKGTPVEVLYQDGGKAATVMRELLASSGTGQLGTYDVLGFGQGYGLDGTTGATSAINAASFDQLSQGPLVATPVAVTLAGKTFAECFGGLLALAQWGVVVRGDDLLAARRQRLALVSTEAGGSQWQVKITDNDLLTSEGEAVVLLRKRDVPNTITVTVPQGADDADTILVQDRPAAKAQGTVPVEYSLPLAGKVAHEQVQGWVLARFNSAQTEQVIEVRLVPWLDIDVGDLVRLELTHFAIWQWSTGTLGYTGQGRVLGYRRDLRGAVAIATILIDGATTKPALCPAMQVVAWAGPAGAPTTIDVPQRYYAHLKKTLDEAGGNIRLWHFEAGLGNEAGGGNYDVSAVVDTGAVARITVAAVGGGAVLSAFSWLTLPDLAGGTAFQDDFAHVGVAGAVWG